MNRVWSRCFRGRLWNKVRMRSRELRACKNVNYFFKACSRHSGDFPMHWFWRWRNLMPIGTSEWRGWSRCMRMVWCPEQVRSEEGRGEVKNGGCGVVDPGGGVRRMNRCEVDGGSGVESTAWLLSLALFYSLCRYIVQYKFMIIKWSQIIIHHIGNLVNILLMAWESRQIDTILFPSQYHEIG